MFSLLPYNFTACTLDANRIQSLLDARGCDPKFRCGVADRQRDLQMSATRQLVSFAFGLLLGGCGLYVPEIQENPLNGNEGQKFVQEIALNIRCEIQDAVVDLYAKNGAIDPQNRNLAFFDSWGAQITLTLTIDEKGSLNPVSSWLPTGTPTTPSSIFSLNLGATLSSESQRVDKISSFFLVSDLKKLEACPDLDRNRGPFILESDLKLEEWLFDTMEASGTGNLPAPASVSGPFKSNVLSHEVKFDIISSGNITPGWKLKQSTVNQSGNFLTGSRDRTQDLIITFGPVDTTWVLDPKTGRPAINPRTGKPIIQVIGLSSAAEDAALSSQIGNAVSNGVRSALQQ